MPRTFLALTLWCVGSVIAGAVLAKAAEPLPIVFIPLDERFTTRDLWLNLAPLAGDAFEIRTPPVSLLSRLKVEANLTALHHWIEGNIDGAHAVIASVEMVLYGGLIASRISNDTYAQVKGRLDWLLALTNRHPARLYLSSVVMRIPAYNGDFEEPWYWGAYGRDLFEYSFFLSRYHALGDPADKAMAQQYADVVPPNALSEFLWRRARNDNITRALVQNLFPQNHAQGEQGARLLYITLDDSGVYGLNVDEAAGLKELRKALQVDPSILMIYPGADEVQSALLARASIEARTAKVTVCVVWRVPSAVGLVPNYENQAILLTVQDQLAAAGATVLNCSSDTLSDIAFLVNNFEATPQLEASQQVDHPATEYEALLKPALLCQGVIGWADVRYSNGGDLSFVSWLNSSGWLASGSPFAYAAWNTDGNTLGTVAANAVLLSLFGPSEASRRFTLLRLLEDVRYQAVVRPLLNAYSILADGSNTQLSNDLTFYDHFVLKPLRRDLDSLRALSNTSAFLAGVSFPWNRTFEIGLSLTPPRPLEPGHPSSTPAAVPPPGVDRLPVKVTCHIIVSGGSTAALAAALVAADEEPGLRVCLTEPTDWLGGQLTSSLISAIDFGPANSDLRALPRAFVDLLSSLGFPARNPGGCWVSKLCYDVSALLDGVHAWIKSEVGKRANLRVFYMTVVTGVEVDAEHNIRALEAVVRAPLNVSAGFDQGQKYSKSVPDWYSGVDSPYFTKSSLRLSRPDGVPAVLDASELGDVLVLSDAEWTQGNELQEIQDSGAHETCGQAIVFPFYMRKHKQRRRSNSPRQQHTLGANYSLGKFSWQQVWEYRRVQADNISLAAWGSTNGDGNDYPYGYHLLPARDARAQKPWAGGLNLTTLAAAEEYSLGFADWFARSAPVGVSASVQLSAGTSKGLSKVPYIRDTRRSVGVGSFRLRSGDLSSATRFPDTIAIGDYLYFDAHNLHESTGCEPLRFNGSLAPYYIPLRALTNLRVPNLVVAGKTMAQTNAANAATRLHPVEWSSGTAAGVFVAMLARAQRTTTSFCQECTTNSSCPLRQRVALHAPLEFPTP